MDFLESGLKTGKIWPQPQLVSHRAMQRHNCAPVNNTSSWDRDRILQLCLYWNTHTQREMSEISWCCWSQGGVWGCVMTPENSPWSCKAGPLCLTQEGPRVSSWRNLRSSVATWSALCWRHPGFLHGSRPEVKAGSCHGAMHLFQSILNFPRCCS